VSVTLTLIGNEPVAPEIPVISPVEVLSERPEGNAPLASAHVLPTPVPPETVIGNV
jgi:hypothetical protein